MNVEEYWQGGRKYFAIKLKDGEARMCLSPCNGRSMQPNLAMYDVDMFPAGKIFYVDFLKVSPVYRNQGLGTAVLQHAIKWASRYKNVLILDAIGIDAGMDHHRLVKFYLSHGFRFCSYKYNEHSMYYHTRTTRRYPKRNLNAMKVVKLAA